MGNAKNRVYKINWIMARVRIAASQEKAIDEEKLIAECCIHFGSGRRYVKEYINQLALTNSIVRVAGMIFTPEQYEFEKSSVRSSDGEIKTNGEIENA